MSRSSHALRSRIALALGLSVLVPLTHAPDGAAAPPLDTGSGDRYCLSPDTTTTTTTTVDTGGGPGGSGGGSGAAGPECAPAGFVAATAVGASSEGGCTVTDVIAEGVYDPAVGACCYAVATSCGGSGGEDKHFDCGCYGRPLVVADEVIAAPPTRRADWAGPERPLVSDLDPAQRARLAAYWLDNARAEHSSVAGFARLVLDLLAAGAPAALVDRAQVAGADELRHALACYALATAYDGRAWGPGTLSSAPIPLTGDLVALAVATARDGCVGETIAATFAHALADRATDPVVRGVLGTIAAEEAAHAELSWEILAWCLAAGGPEVARAVAAAFAEPPVIPDDGTPDDPRLVAHGLVSSAERARICGEAHAEVVAVLARSLLARAA